ncbi:uncharacterized protein [Argopecten irradians]|uniref:uncharacterized protein n=1 Tax=Argopecten irradians TaxID=31199 RepID=UPI003720C72B
MMKATWFLFAFAVGILAVNGSKLPSHDVKNEKDAMQSLRSVLDKLKNEKRATVSTRGNEKRATVSTRGNEKRDHFGIGDPTHCNIHDFVYLFTSLPSIKDALFEVGSPQDVLAIVDEMLVVFSKLRSIVGTPFQTPLK